MSNPNTRRSRSCPRRTERSANGDPERQPRARPSRRRFVPQLDGLEEKILLSTLKVTSLGDSGHGTLRDAIASANDGDKIAFSAALDHGTILLTSGEIDFSTSLDIEGPGAGLLTISGNGAGRIFGSDGSGSDVTIAGLTLTDGLADDGGAILADDDALNLRNLTFTNNEALTTDGLSSASGGAVADSGNSLSIQGCTFTSNSAVAGFPGTSFPRAVKGPSEGRSRQPRPACRSPAAPSALMWPAAGRHSTTAAWRSAAHSTMTPSSSAPASWRPASS